MSNWFYIEDTISTWIDGNDENVIDIVSSENVGQMYITKFSSTQYITWWITSGFINFSVIIYSGGSYTIGTTVQLPESGNILFNNVDVIDSSRFIVSYSTNGKGSMVVGSISGSSITFGATCEVPVFISFQFSIAMMYNSTEGIWVGANQSTSTSNIKVAAHFSVSGTTITLNDPIPPEISFTTPNIASTTNLITSTTIAGANRGIIWLTRSSNTPRVDPTLLTFNNAGGGTTTYTASSPTTNGTDIWRVIDSSFISGNRALAVFLGDTSTIPWEWWVGDVDTSIPLSSQPNFRKVLLDNSRVFVSSCSPEPGVSLVLGFDNSDDSVFLSQFDLSAGSTPILNDTFSLFIEPTIQTGLHMAEHDSSTVLLAYTKIVGVDRIMCIRSIVKS